MDIEGTPRAARRLELQARLLQGLPYNQAIEKVIRRTRYFLSHDGEQMAYRKMGEPSHPAVVLLHGYGGNSTSWWAMGHPQRLVGLGFFVVALDLRGHGASAKPTTSSGWENDAEMRDIISLTHDELQLTRYLAVSQSHGSIELAKLLTVDDRLMAAVLGEYGDGMTSAAHRQSWWYDTLAAQKEAEAKVATTKEERTSALALAQLQRHQAITTPEAMAQVAVPVLVIHGSEDYYNGASCRGPTGQNTVSAQSDFATLAAHFRYGELAVVPGGHGAASTTPEFAQHVDTFLLTHKPRTSTLRLPHIFSDQMILQRGKPLPVWGWTAPGSGVTVSLGSCQVRAVASDADGQWSLELPAQKENSEGQELTVTGDNGDELVLHDVLIGEVWLCSGQSNMQWPMDATEHVADEAPAANHRTMRLFQIDTVVATQPQDDVAHTWMPCTTETVKSFSAVAYHFGEELHRKLSIPVGLINTSWGGTEIEPWTNLEGFDAVPSLSPWADRVRSIKQTDEVDAQTPSAIYNAMIHPLAPFALAGFTWYQGESNCVKCDTSIYIDKTLALVSGWREVFGQPDLPFYFVQLAPFKYTQAFGPSWEEQGFEIRTEWLPELQEAQQDCLDVVKHCGMVVISDLTSDVNDIHPTNKRDVGRRLSLWALAKDYGRDDIVCSGPILAQTTTGPKSAGTQTIKLTFEHVAAGLVATDGKPLRYFELAGVDGMYHPASAVILPEDRATIEVLSSAVADPVCVRYAWHEAAIGNLANTCGLPAGPFRTKR